ncbi:MAG: RHS repeat-associated core domain-containing protein [Anaerolineales bacterium]
MGATFANGDRFGVRARANGLVEVYKNGVYVEAESVAGWTYAGSGGYIGLWLSSDASDTLLDDFGGGNVGGPTPTPTNTPTRTPTPTNTPIGPTNTPTRTPTPTNTPTNTPTPTNTSSGCPTSDDFNRSDSTNLGSNWTERAGDLSIVSNTLRNAGTATDNIATICGTYTNVLVSSQVQIASSSGTVSVGARLGGYSGGIPSQGYTAEILSNGTVKLWRVDTWAQLGSTYTISGFSLGTWYTLALRANGSAISVEVNGSTVIGPVTNTAFTSGDAGVWSYSPSSAGSHRFDDFSVTVLGGGFHTKTKGLAMIRARSLAVVSTPPVNTTWRVYYYAGGKPIAMREMPANDSTGTLYYLHSDHLGSTSVTTNASGAVVARQWYYPFGSVRGSTGTLLTQRTFTGQYTHDASLGSLMYFNARYMSPTLGRFVSADSIVPEPGNPQALNRYMFVYGNPLKYTDPSGHDPHYCETAECEKRYLDTLSRIQRRQQWWQQLLQSAENAISNWLMPTVGGGPVVAPVPAQQPLQLGATATPTGAPSTQQPPAPATLQTQAVIKGTATATTTKTASPSPTTPLTLYHYTSDVGLTGIVASQSILPSLGTGPNANFGQGVYFTDISPARAAIGSSYQLSRALFTTPWKNGNVSSYAAVNVSGLTVMAVSPVFSQTYGPASIYLYPTTSPLAIGNRIVSLGPVSYTNAAP